MQFPESWHRTVSRDETPEKDMQGRWVRNGYDSNDTTDSKVVTCTPQAKPAQRTLPDDPPQSTAATKQVEGGPGPALAQQC